MLDRLEVAFLARKTGVESDSKSRLNLVQARQKLRNAIAKFHKDSRTHLPSSVFVSGLDVVNDDDIGEEWYNIEDEDEEDGIIDDGDPSQPEKQAIAMPSTLGYPYLKSHNLESLAEKEVTLRIGEMNDAVRAVRAGIAYKSYIYYAKVRNASSTRARLRSYDDVRLTDASTNKHVRIYVHARNALQSLFDQTKKASKKKLNKLLEKYPCITKADLKVNTTLIEPFTHGLRNLHASWIWKLGVGDGVDESQWLRDCKPHLSCKALISDGTCSTPLDVASSLRAGTTVV